MAKSTSEYFNPKEPLRIVCAKCVRIVRVHVQQLDVTNDGVRIATECCCKRIGFVDSPTIIAARQGGRELTTDAIRETSAHDDMIENLEERATTLKAWADALRWSRCPHVRDASDE